MEKLVDKLKDLRSSISNRISDLIETHGVPSVHNTENVLVIKDDEFCFNLDGGHWLVEISEDKLIDNEGYTYSHDVLDIEDLCSALDNIVETSVFNVKNIQGT